MSTKSPSNFWKKLGLGRKASSTQVNRPPSIQSHATNSTALANNEDDRSVKSKRLSGVFPHRKQSTNSIKRLHQMTAAHPDTPHVPVLPSGSNTTTATATTTATTLSGVESKQQQGDGGAVPPLGRHVEQTHQSDHVESSTPPPMEPDLGKQQQQEDIDSTLDVTTRDDIKTGDQRQQRSTTTLESNINSCSAGQQQQASATDQQQPFTPTTNNKHNNNTTNTNAPRLVKSTKSASSLKKLSNQSLSQIPTKETKSRLRQPSRTNSTATAGSGHSTTITPSASSSSSSLQQQLKDSSVTSRLTTATSTPPPPMPSLILPASNGTSSTDTKDQLIQQLQESLQTEQSINRVLQGQKEAITRDLDYFSLTVDELMEEKESLVQKYEEEKVKSQTKEEDLNVLLEKLKTSTDNARDRSMEVDQWKTEIENIKEEVSMEQNELKSVLKRKDQEIIRLKNELASTKEEVNTLSSRLEMLLQETQKSPTNGSHSHSSNHHHHHHSIATGAIETPSASPRLDAQYYNDHDEDSTMHGDEEAHTTRGNKKLAHHPGLSVSTAPPLTCPALDDELMSLTKEKERLQSDYGKIPLSGGGPTSRRRKEQLEEMLDEVDSQLSKVKQKIRKS